MKFPYTERQILISWALHNISLIFRSTASAGSSLTFQLKIKRLQKSPVNSSSTILNINSGLTCQLIIPIKCKEYRRTEGVRQKGKEQKSYLYFSVFALYSQHKRFTTSLHNRALASSTIRIDSNVFYRRVILPIAYMHHSLLTIHMLMGICGLLHVPHYNASRWTLSTCSFLAWFPGVYQQQGH